MNSTKLWLRLFTDVTDLIAGIAFVVGLMYFVAHARWSEALLCSIAMDVMSIRMQQRRANA